MKSSLEVKWLYIILALIPISLIIMSIVNYSAILALPQSKSTINEEHTLSISGVGVVTAIPNRVTINIGVDTQASTAQEALKINGEIVNKVITNLRQLGLEEKEMKTAYLSLQPQYIYPQNKEPVLIGYKASNTITITTRFLERAGIIIDRAVASGANRIDNIYFTISEEELNELKNEAIRRAIYDAKRKVDNVISAMNVKIIGVKSIVILDTTYPPIIIRELKAPTSAPTPILPGETQITVNVQVIYLIG